MTTTYEKLSSEKKIRENKLQNSPYCLAITPKVELWDTSYPILFLNEDCIPYDPSGTYAEILKNSVVFNDPYLDAAILEKITTYVPNQLNHILPHLSNYLNGVNKCKMSDEQWAILIGMFVYYYLNAFHIAYVRLKRMKEEYPDICVPVLNYNPRPPHNIRDFMGNLFTDSYHQWIIATVAAELHIEAVHITEKVEQSHVKQNPSLRTRIGKHFGMINGVRHILKSRDVTPVKIKIRELCSQLYLLIWPLILSISVGQKVFTTSLFYKRSWVMDPHFFSSTKLPWLSLDHIPSDPRFNSPVKEGIRREIREKLLNIPDLDEFMHIALKNMHHCIPTIYLEGFNHLLTYSKKYYPWDSTPCGIFEFHATWVVDDAFNLWMAHMKKEKGTPLLFTQHAGAYNVSNFSNSHIFLLEHKAADIFYVWCNPAYDNGKFRGISANKLIHLKEIGPCNAKKNILYGSSPYMNPSQNLFVGYLMLNPTSTYLFENLSDFISTLSSSCFKELRFRSYQGQYGFSEKQRLHDRFPDLIIESWEKPFIERLSECRLYVVDYYSTTVSEAFSSNHPTICIWDPACVSVNENGKPFVDELKRVGIAFESPVDAAHTVNKIYNDVDAWWNAPERVEAVRAFCDRFAYVAEDPVAEWREEFKQYLKNN